MNDLNNSPSLKVAEMARVAAQQDVLIESLRQAREFVDYVRGSYDGGGRVITFSEEDREWMEAILGGKKYYPAAQPAKNTEGEE